MPKRFAFACAGLALVLAGCGGTSAHGSRSTAPAGPASSGPASSAGPQPVRTFSSGAPPSPTPTTEVGLVVDGSGSDLTPPASPTTRPAQPAKYTADECYGIEFDPGFRGGCHLLTSSLGTAVLEIESAGTEERTLVWTVANQQAHLALRRVRTLPVAAGSVDAQDGGSEATTYTVSDLNNDGVPAFVVQTPAAQGVRPPLASLDVVQGSGIVGLYRNLHGGRARKAPGGGLETWTPDTAPDAGGQLDHAVFQYQSGQWRVVSDGRVTPGRVPNNTGSF